LAIDRIIAELAMFHRAINFQGQQSPGHPWAAAAAVNRRLLPALEQLKDFSNKAPVDKGLNRFVERFV
jgi:hypothetical protein